MPRDVQDLAYNVTGQSFFFDAPCRPSSVTSVTVLPWTAGDDDTAETATTGSASIDAVNTTFDAASGVSQSSPRTLNLTATTSIVTGRQYLAVNATKEAEWVEVTAIASGVSVTSRAALLNDYANADTFQGTRITISVLDAWIQDQNKISAGVNPNPGYRLRWIWVGTPPGGVQTTYVNYTYADVVRSPGMQHGVTPADMESFLPGWRDMLPHMHQDDGGQALIDEAYRDVKARMHGAGLPDDQVRNGEAMAQAVKYAAQALMMRSKSYTGGDPLLAQEAKNEYVAYMAQFFTVVSKAAVATGASGAATMVPARGLWSR